MIGETIKDFKITHRLGAGSYGEVWAAEQQIVHTRVAIKLLHAQISTDQQYVKRFFSEAVAVGKIKHAGIVKIFDVGFHDGRAFLIMELLEGEPLSERIARAGRLPAGDVAEIGRQIASILEATHAVGIVHRDLKPDNVYLVPDLELASKERVKILDFGFAKLDMGLTGTSETMGTPAYIAPEQWAQASKVDGRADVYSLGCIVFKMCCGRLPFQAETIFEWYGKHRDALPPRAHTLVPELPGELDELIARMLAKSPADRPTARAVVATCARIAAHVSGGDSAHPAADLAGGAGDFMPTLDAPSSLPSSLAASGEASQRRSLALIAVSAVAGIAMLAAVAVFLATRRTPPSPLDAPRPPPDARPAPPDAPPEPPKPTGIANRWVRIDPPVTPYPLGVPDRAPRSYVGFREARGIVTPPRPYEIQEHEVTWAELEPWLANIGAHVAYPPWAAEAGARGKLPATNITWTLAQEYCQSIGGELPTEEQWEYAARGPGRRPNPWGADPLDPRLTRAYAGPGAVPSPVEDNRQDQTPDPGGPVWDLAGNVQEWTLGLWREDLPGKDESDVQRGQITARAIRGLPLAARLPARIQPDAAAFRTRLCATGSCVEKTREILAYVGFRCARSPER